MAISLKTAGTWARVVTDPSSVTIPGSPATGDRMFLFANWKTFDVTVADPSGWTPIVNSFADGTTAAGNGTGSVSVAAWYRDWQSGDGNPSLNWSASPTEAHAVVMLWTKAGGDTWSTPAFRTGAIAVADPFTVDASATVTVADASVVIGMVALRDDSTAMTRATDAIDDTGGLVTWNGNYVESPAMHFNSTTGLDMSGDLGHRFVTTGAAGVTLHMDGDITAGESGSALFVLQALFVSDPKTATPTTATLTTTTFAPAVTTPRLATPTTRAIATATFAPTASTTAHQLVTPSLAATALTAFAPTVTASDHKSVTPPIGQIVTAALVATVTTPSLATPGSVALTSTTFGPDVFIEAGGVTVTPTTADLTTSIFAPTAFTPRLVTPPTVDLATTVFAPETIAPRLAIPTTASLTATYFAPTVAAGALVTPDVQTLSETTFAPTIIAAAMVIPDPASLTLTTYRPRLTAPVGPGWIRPAIRGGARYIVRPRPAYLETRTYPATVIVIDDADLLSILRFA